MQKEHYGIIYKVTCQTTNKIYIGQTTTFLGHRKGLHKHKALYENDFNNHFHNAIRKYGWDDFIWEIIDTAESFQELNEKEKYWIKYYNSINNGYNTLLGGQKEKANTEKFLLACGSVPFVAYTTQGEYLGEFLNQREFADQYNIAAAHVSDLINDKLNFCNNLILIKKDKFSEEKLQEKLKKFNNNKRGSKFIAINLETNKKYGPFNNQKECLKELHLSSNHIGEVLSGKRKSQGGYTFQYYNK